MPAASEAYIVIIRSSRKPSALRVSVYTEPHQIAAERNNIAIVKGRLLGGGENISFKTGAQTLTGDSWKK